MIPKSSGMFFTNVLFLKESQKSKEKMDNKGCLRLNEDRVLKETLQLFTLNKEILLYRKIENMKFIARLCVFESH